MMLGQPAEQVIPQDDLEQEVNIEDDMDGALEGELRIYFWWGVVVLMVRAPSYWAERSPSWRSPECEHC